MRLTHEDRARIRGMLQQVDSKGVPMYTQEGIAKIYRVHISTISRIKRS